MKARLSPLPERTSGKVRLTVCVNDRGSGAITPSCGPRGGHDLATIIPEELAACGLDWEFQTIECLGLCEQGPNVRLVPGNNWFHGVSTEDAARLVELAAGHMQPLIGRQESSGTD